MNKLNELDKEIEDIANQYALRDTQQQIDWREYYDAQSELLIQKRNENAS